MPIPPFKLERFFAKYEFSVKYLLSASDCEGLYMSELLQLASPASRENWEKLKLDYTDSQGNPLLREEISHGYANIKPDQVVAAVPEELIFICMQTLLKAGDHVIAIVPAYQSLHELALSIGCTMDTWQLQPSGSGWSLDLNQLERCFTPQTRLLVINFPNNPTGYLPSKSELDAIIEIACRHGVYVFSDEMYRLLEANPSDRLPAVCDLYERGISLTGLSKSFSLPGLRLGWLATRAPRLVQDWVTYKDYTTICNSAPSEALGIIALQNTDAITARNMQIIKSNVQLADQFFARHSRLFDWQAPQAGSISFPSWRGPGIADDFCKQVLEKHGLMIVPGSIFDHPGQRFRVGLGRKNFPEALEHLEEYLGSL